MPCEFRNRYIKKALGKALCLCYMIDFFFHINMHLLRCNRCANALIRYFNDYDNSFRTGS